MKSQEEVARQELDVLVAEKVMGYTWTPMTDAGDSETWSGHATLLNPEGKTRAQRWKKDGSLSTWCCDCPELPRFSTDISAAWQVVDKLRSQGRFMSIAILGDGVHVSLDGGAGGGWHGGTYREETAPLAICRAALKAV